MFRGLIKRGRGGADLLRSLSGDMARDERGSVLIMAAILIPVLLLATLGSTTVMMALAKRKELTAIAQTACNRAVKPLRMVEVSDADRQLRGQALFDDLAKERGFVITSRTVTAGWLEATVQAEASIPVVPGYGTQFALKAKANETCRGIPPYPKLNEVVLSSNFVTPGGIAVTPPYQHSVGRWGVFTAAQVGWEGHTGSGIEIQDWKVGFELNAGDIAQLPPGVGNTFVVELDSGPLPGKGQPVNATCGKKEPGHNSSMYKTFELHPGTYRISLWFRARVRLSDVLDDPKPTTNTSNKVVVYLEGTRPVSTKNPVIVWDDYDTKWNQRYYDFTVTSYGLYRLHVAAEGCSDGSGGLFNDLRLTYIRRPAPEYNDPTPPPPVTN